MFNAKNVMAAFDLNNDYCLTAAAIFRDNISMKEVFQQMGDFRRNMSR
jgi:hypothetical protein